MKLTREHICSIIFYSFQRGLSRQECIDELKSLLADKWFNEFNRGRRSLKGELHEGPPKTAVVSERIDAVRELIMKDPNVTYRDKGILRHFFHQHTFNVT